LETVIAGFGPRGELPLPLPLSLFPSHSPSFSPTRVPCASPARPQPRGPRARVPAAARTAASRSRAPASPAALRALAPTRHCPDDTAPTPLPRRRLAPRPHGLTPWRHRAPAAACPGVASRAPTWLAWPRRTQHVLTHVTIAVRRSTFSLIHFLYFSLVDVLRHATIHFKIHLY
jgi:hypothetical protein